jgi:hypothetical protein
MFNHLSGKPIAATCNWDGIYDEGDVVHEVEEVLGDVSGTLVGLIDYLSGAVQVSGHE